MDIITHAVVFVAGALFGMAAYRYTLKRDPEKLEAWAFKVKSARDAAERRFR